MAALVTWVGYMAGTLTTIAFLPQAWHVWKTKRADDLHLGTLISFTAGIVLWLVYGIARHEPPIILANAVTLLLQCVILYLKLRFTGAHKQMNAKTEGRQTN